MFLIFFAKIHPFSETTKFQPIFFGCHQGNLDRHIGSLFRADEPVPMIHGAYIVYKTFWMCQSIWSCISLFQLLKQVVNTFCLIHSSCLDVIKSSIYSTFSWSFKLPPHLFWQCPEEGEVGQRNAYTNIFNICRCLHNCFPFLYITFRPQKYKEILKPPKFQPIFCLPSPEMSDEPYFS